MLRSEVNPVEIFDRVRNQEVLLQLSGGKDSIAALLMLIEHEVPCRAVHFTHRWSYGIPTQEAIAKCSQFGVQLTVVDITRELSDLLLNNFSGRPCRFCKGIMDQKTVEYAVEKGISYICTGDSKEDKMLFNRLERNGKGGTPYFNRYFNQAVELPAHFQIFRPLAKMDNDEIQQYLAGKGISVRRVGDTGDKYFEYSREGCPLQFKDYGAEYTIPLMDQLKDLNEKASQFAVSHKIRASVHLPSGFVLTIPRGYEKKCREYIQLNVPPEKPLYRCYTYIIDVVVSQLLLEKTTIIQTILARILERLECSYTEVAPLHLSFEGGAIDAEIWEKERQLHIHLFSQKRFSTGKLHELIIELFHTDHFDLQEICSNEHGN